MRAHSYAAIALAVSLAGCGGGGDDKTGIGIYIEINGSVPQATVDSITEIVVVVSAGASRVTERLPVNGKLSDYNTSFRYVDDGTFIDMDVSVKLELMNAGNTAVFSDSKNIVVSEGSTEDLEFRFGDGVVVDGGVDSNVCPTPPACVLTADKACIDGTVVDFGTEAALTSGGVELSIIDARNGALVGTGTVDSCGRFSTGSFTPPVMTGSDVDLVLDDPTGGADNFKKTVLRFSVARMTVLNGQKLRVLTATLDDSLSTAAGLCVGACTSSLTFSGRGSIVVFYRHLGALTGGVRVTSVLGSGKPSLLSGDVFYFSDNRANRQTMITRTQADTSATGAAIFVGLSSMLANVGGTGVPGPNLSWVPRPVTAVPGSIVILDLETAMHTCDPLMQATTGCRNADDGCYPNPQTAMQNFCSHAGTVAAGATCTNINDCMIGLTCNGGLCRTLCRAPSGAPGCTTPATCQAVPSGNNVGACR